MALLGKLRVNTSIFSKKTLGPVIYKKFYFHFDFTEMTVFIEITTIKTALCDSKHSAKIKRKNF